MSSPRSNITDRAYSDQQCARYRANLLVRLVKNAPAARKVIRRFRDKYTAEEIKRWYTGLDALTVRSRVSADGKTLTTTVKGTDLQGKPVDGTNIYEKQ